MTNLSSNAKPAPKRIPKAEGLAADKPTPKRVAAKGGDSELALQVLRRHRFTVSKFVTGLLCANKERMASKVTVVVERKVEGWVWTTRCTFTERGGFERHEGVKPTLLEAVQQVCLAEGMY